MKRYWTDREYGERPRTQDDIDDRVWGGLRTLVQTGLSDGSFGYRFPERCPDGSALCGCDEHAFVGMLRAEVPGTEWPLPRQERPATSVILDVLEFCASAIGKPIRGFHHDYHRHHHLTWDREAGLARFVSNVNVVFARNGVAYELAEDGQARRLLPQPLGNALRGAIFKTGDPETDGLLEAARRRILLPKPEDRRDALEKLWDAFERLKTLEAGADKRAQAEALLDATGVERTRFRALLGAEAMALTHIGNTFRIRHSETTQEILSSPEQVDYLFGRMFSFVWMVLKATGRAG